MPITFLNPGNSGVIKAVRGNDAVVKHLQDLGFLQGTEVRIISQVGGNLIVDVKGTRLAIEKSLAGRIFV